MKTTATLPHRALAVITALCVALTFIHIAPLRFKAGAAETAPSNPTQNGAWIFANGTPVIIKEVGGVTGLYAADGVNAYFANISDCHVYGGWENADYIGNTSVTMESGTLGAYTLFGGNREGNITGNTNVTITGGTVGYVYGGGRGDNGAGGGVSGTAKITIGNAMVTEVYGGGNQACATTGNTNITINGGAIISYLCGGGFNGSVTSNTNITIEDGDFIQIHGGGNSVGANVGGNTNITINNGNFECVYGGGNNGEVKGNTKLTINNGVFEWEVCGGGLFELAKVNNNTNITINGGTFNNIIAGAGFYAPVAGNTNIQITSAICTFFNDGSPKVSVFGSGGDPTAVVGGSTNITIEGGNFSKIYGAGNSDVTGNTNITIKGGIIPGTVIFEGGGGSGVNIGGASVTIDDTIAQNVNCIYKPDISSQFMVTFNTDGGSTVPYQTISHGDKITEPTAAPTKSGFTFAGWYKEAALINEWDFTTDTVTTNTTLYAKWENIPAPPVISTPAGTLTSGTVGMVYSATLAATNSPASWTVSAGALPPGLTIDNDGKITGTPSAAGMFTFSVTATNSDGTSAAVAFNITIVDPATGTPSPNPNPGPRPNPTPTPPEPKPLRGDINGDGKVTPADALIVLKVTVRKEKPTAAEISLYDMNGDGRVTPKDALIILKLAIAQGNVPAAVTAAEPPQAFEERVKKENRG